MKILLVCQSSRNGNNATPNLCKSLAAALAGRGHQILFLDRETYLPMPGVEYFTAESESEALLHEITGGSFGQNGRLKTILRLLLHPRALYAAVYLVILRRSLIQKAFTTKIQQICAIRQVDAAIAFSAPHTAIAALAAAKISCDKYACMYDPYSLMPFYQTEFHQKNDCAIFESMKHVFAVELLVKAMEGTHLQPYLPKTSVLGFPAIVPPQKAERPSVLPRGKINFVFIGTVYKDIRSPKALLELFCQLEESEYMLTFAGGGWDCFEQDFLRPYKDRLGNLLQILGTVPRHTASALMQHADILVDIGNKGELQMPSKIFEYVSTGRPVLHITQADNDAASTYYKKYPLALNVPAIKIGQKDILPGIRAFVQDSKRKCVDYSQVENIYREHTPDFVASEIEKVLQPAQK